MKSCFVCHYDLHGSQETGRCPECGWRFTPGTTVVSAEILDRRPDIIQSVTAAILLATAIGILLRYPTLSGHQLWITWGLLVATSFLLAKNFHAWYRQLSRPPLQPGRAALVLSDERVSLTDGNKLLRDLHAESIASLKVNEFRRNIYIDIQADDGSRIDLRVRASPDSGTDRSSPSTIDELKTRLCSIASRARRAEQNRTRRAAQQDIPCEP